MFSVLEYYSPVWCSAAACHLGLLDRIVSGAASVTMGQVQCDLEYRRFVASLCKLLSLFHNPLHSVNAELPDRWVAAQLTNVLLLCMSNEYALTLVRCGTGQFMRSFVLSSVGDSNSLDGSVFDVVG